MGYYNTGKSAPAARQATRPTTGQGAPATNAQAWPVAITDGADTLGTAAHPVVVTAAGGSGEDGINRRLLEATALRERDLVRLSLQTRAGERIVTSYERGVR